MGERWKGNAKGCKDVIYIAVGTGIGASILVEDHIFMALTILVELSVGYGQPFENKLSMRCFEFPASGNGIARVAHSS
jgi:predicted NBD/HSP70 family sugar kinase